MEITIRNEKESDYREVETLTREAFWNLHVHGCDEHFLAHSMRNHPDFIPGLDFIAVVDNKIEGHPRNYCKHGFKSSREFNISNAEGRFPFSLLVRELEKGMLNNNAWKIYFSNVYELNAQSAQEFDTLFPPKEKKYQYSQEEFNIASRAYLD